MIQGKFSLTRFKIIENINVDIQEKLKQYTFVPCTQSDQESRGWTPIGDIFDKEWSGHTSIENAFVFNFRYDVKKINSKVLKMEFERQLKDELKRLKKDGIFKISKERKAELKDQIKLRLLSKTDPTPTIVPVILHNDGKLWFFNTSKTLLEKFQELFLSSFEASFIEDCLDTSEIVEDDTKHMLTWLWQGTEENDLCNFSFDIHIGNQISLSNTENTNKVSVSGELANMSEAKDALSKGCHVTKGLFVIENEEQNFEAIFNNDKLYQINSIKLPNIDIEGEEKEDLSEYTQWIDFIGMLEKFLNFYDEIFSCWLNEVKDKKLWEKRKNKIDKFANQ